MHRLWPTDAIPGEALQLLPLPRHFSQVAELVSEDMISAPCGPDPDVHAGAVRAYTEAGFDEVYIGQVGGECEGSSSSTRTRCCPGCGKPGRADAVTEISLHVNGVCRTLTVDPRMSLPSSCPRRPRAGPPTASVLLQFPRRKRPSPCWERTLTCGN